VVNLQISLKKKGDSLHICINYHTLNSQTIKNRYALPCIDELLNQLFSIRKFSKIDFISGYWQIAIAAADQYKIAF